MQFVDRAMIALSELASRTALFGDASLKNIVKASYGIDDAVLQGAATARFSSFTLGGLDKLDTEETDVQSESIYRVDALWRGSIRIAASLPRALVESARITALSLAGLDEEVAAANGGVLPSGADLEASRRAVLQSRLAALSDHTGAAAEAVVSIFLERAGARDVATLVDRPDSANVGHMQVTFSAPIGGETFTQMDFPVAVAALIRDPTEAGFSLALVIAATRRIQQQMRRAGFEPKQPSEAGGLGKAVTALIVPDGWFDDDGWPGADKNARIQGAVSWMARERIGLVAVAPPA
jgi:hypothetical protein